MLRSTRFLNEFERKIKFENVLLTKFEDWLHYQQTIEMDPATNAAWLKFLDSFEQLIREQSMLLASFEDLAKSQCGSSLLTLELSVDQSVYVAGQTMPAPVSCGAPVTYTLNICNKGTTSIQNVVVTDYLSDRSFAAGTLAPGGCMPFRISAIAGCVDVPGAPCKVSDWAWATGEVVTDNGNYTITVYSTQQTIVVDCSSGPIPYPGVQVTAKQTTKQSQMD